MFWRYTAVPRKPSGSMKVPTFTYMLAALTVESGSDIRRHLNPFGSVMCFAVLLSFSPVMMAFLSTLAAGTAFFGGAALAVGVFVAPEVFFYSTLASVFWTSV